ncbi:hypothetical protein [Tenacibaculum halocynthiae]|uniref:hypothetical protein n=1 Tax=Tenacibaculum halocynthiae TaxID=1254437 RepID=UPI003D64AE17
MEILKLTGIILMGIYTFIKLYTNFLGDDKQYKKFQKANKRFGVILESIVAHPLYSMFFLLLNRTLVALSFVLGALYGFLAYIKYNNVYVAITVVLILWAASINILYRGKVLYLAFNKESKV